jgi:hypothetical protein
MAIDCAPPRMTLCPAAVARPLASGSDGSSVAALSPKQEWTNLLTAASEDLTFSASILCTLRGGLDALDGYACNGLGDQPGGICQRAVRVLGLEPGCGFVVTPPICVVGTWVALDISYRFLVAWAVSTTDIFAQKTATGLPRLGSTQPGEPLRNFIVHGESVARPRAEASPVGSRSACPAEAYRKTAANLPPELLLYQEFIPQRAPLRPNDHNGMAASI